MRIIEEWQSFVHTHFQTDGQQLAAESMRALEAALLPTLRTLGIVYGFHLERSHHDPGIRVVLECRPAERELAVIRRKLAATLRPIPRRPRPTVVRFASEEEESLPRKPAMPTIEPEHATVPQESSRRGSIEDRAER